MNNYIFEIILSVILCISIPFFLFARIRKRWTISWLVFMIGAGSFIFSQVIHLPLNHLLEKINWIEDLQSAAFPNMLRTALILGLTAGLCEELTRWFVLVGMSKIRKSPLRTLDAIGLGIGHGGIEAIILGGIFTSANITTALALQLNDPGLFQMSAENWAALHAHFTPYMALPASGLLPLFERLLAIILHVSLSIWVWKAYQKKNYLLLTAAILYHTLVDSLLVVFGVQKLDFWLMEGLFLLLIIPAVFLAWRFLKQDEEIVPVPPKKEKYKSNFWIILEHEFFYLVRSKRIWIVPLVFSMLGIFSVLIAYFMPELFKTMDQLKEYAHMIPPPTTSDAITQYIKNMNQFGFIIIIVVGMNAVAGEKDKGTAALFLSKPITRTEFILAKGLSQIFLAGLSLFFGALAVFGYILMLFGPIPVFHIALLSLYLLLWMLPIIGFTLLASTIGNSPSSAGALSFGFSFLLLILYSIPLIQGLFPGSLLAIFGDYAAFTEMHPIHWLNISASVSAVVLFILGSLLAVGLLENQELS
jgi:ABC-2 type transport system permease protein